MDQNSVVLCGTPQKQPAPLTSSFPHEHVVLGPEPSNQITALTLQGARKVPVPPTVGPMASN